MVLDEETNALFIADTLPKKFPEFYNAFENLIKDCKVLFSLLPETNDIWAVDYMPVQVRADKFIRFNYKPDYLQGKKWIQTISNADRICENLGIKTLKSDIILDGGNLIKSRNKVIMCDKVIRENPHYSKKKLIKVLIELLEIDELFFVPQQPKDFTGHADGMIRFLDEDTVLINNYTRENLVFQRAFDIAIHNAGLDCIEIPYNPYTNTSNEQARGCYINFLQMEGLIVLPVFDIEEDEKTTRIFEDLFKGHLIKTINSNEIANQGGVLNCITWNICQNKLE